MRIFQYYVRDSFTFFSREEDNDANNNGWAGVIKTLKATGGLATVCIIYEQDIVDGRDLANGLISGSYRNRISDRIPRLAWNRERTMIHIYIGTTLLLSVPKVGDILEETANDLCVETANVIYNLLIYGTMPDSYREEQRVESINLVRPRRSSSMQAAIENMVKVDDEILEDVFTCNMLVDRIKNCDTICSGDKKIKIIVREDNKEMMITNTVFDNNILVINIDDVKEKECDDDELLSTYTFNGLLGQINITNTNAYRDITNSMRYDMPNPNPPDDVF